MPADHGLVDAEVREQTEAVGGGVPIREGLAVELGEPEPALVPRDDAELRRERLDLRSEHLVIHQEAVPRGSPAGRRPRVLEVDPLTVDVCVRHRPVLSFLVSVR